MRRWIAFSLTAVAAVAGIVAVWGVRARGGICIDGMYEDSGEYFGYCADYDSASGALPATIAIVLLVGAALASTTRPGIPAVVVVIIGALVVAVAIAGVVANQALIVYPEDYPAY